MKTPVIPAYLKNLFDKYKYILLVCTVGVLLMLWPEKPMKTTAKPQTGGLPTSESLEVRLQMLLEEMDQYLKSTCLMDI